MPPGPEAVCSPVDSRVSCAGRWAAVARGEFGYSFKHGGWLWQKSKTPDMPWHVCPWCAHDLPSAELVYHRIRESIRKRADG